MRRLAWSLFPLLLATACLDPVSQATASRTQPQCEVSEALPPGQPLFERSPGDVAEASVEWVARHGCKLRVVDVRFPGETANGTVDGAALVPLDQLGEHATHWDPVDPVVLLCRSGRRSARGVELLESMGFSQAASMTGGVLAWERAGYALAPGQDERLPEPPPTKPEAEDSGVEAHLASVRPVVQNAAALLMQSNEGCVDGRETRAVVGTPGGDAGEFVLALSAIESAAERELSREEIESLFKLHLSRFGRFYMHTDVHALEQLHRSLAADPTFAEAVTPEFDRASFEAFLRRPGLELREPLLAHLTQAEHVGCGHLRLLLQEPVAYGIRRELVTDLIARYFRQLWHRPETVSFVVLEGDHHEEAVVNVHTAAPAHASTVVSAIAPHSGAHSLFVNHPEVSSFIRREHVSFLREELEWLGELVDEDELEEAIESAGGRQLSVTLKRLAERLPVYDVYYERGKARVVPRSDDPEPV